MLRDRLICGINDTAIQRKLLSEGDKLKLKDALKLASSMEVAYRDSQELPVPLPTTDPVHKVQTAGRGKHTMTQRQPHHSYSSRGQARQVITKASCHRCLGTDHNAVSCPHRTARCYSCNKVGHVSRACRTRTKTHTYNNRPFKRPHPRSHPICTLSEEADATEYDMDHLSLNNIHSARSTSKPMLIKVMINNTSLSMELNTGAAVSLISKATYLKHWPTEPLGKSATQLTTYSGERIKVCGVVQVDVQYEEQCHEVPLVVVDGEGPSLFGRDWLHVFKLNWKRICHITQETLLKKLLEEYHEVFEEGLGTLVNFKAKIYVDPAATPKFYKARPLPYAYRAKVEEKLTCLVEQGVLEPIQHAEWVAPIVAVLKKDEQKNIRICGDFKCTVNSASKLDKYPIPKIEDLFVKLAGGKFFTKLDMSQAY